jgi:DNA-binding PadR family transcriptional regulator
MADLLTPVEMALIGAIAALADGAYGRAIHQTASKESGLRIPYGSLYVTLHRLEKAGLISSTAVSDPHKGGRPRRYFRVEAAGKRAYGAARVAYARLSKMPLAET